MMLGPDIKRMVRDYLLDVQGDLRLAGDALITGRMSATELSLDGREVELGWIKDSIGWLHSSSTEILRYGDDVSELFPVGTKIRWTQGGGWLYATVTGATYASGAVTLTVSGDTVADADITDNYFSYQYSPPGWVGGGGAFVGCSVYRTAEYTVTAGAWRIVPWTHEHWDTDAMHDTVANNHRIYIPAPGKYRITVWLRTADANLSYVALQIAGGSYMHVHRCRGVQYEAVSFGVELPSTVLDTYVWLGVYAASSNAVINATDGRPGMSVTKID